MNTLCEITLKPLAKLVYEAGKNKTSNQKRRNDSTISDTSELTTLFEQYAKVVNHIAFIILQNNYTRSNFA